MITKLKNIYLQVNPSEKLENKDKMEEMIVVLIHRKVINEQDAELLRKHVCEFPLDFEHFLATIRQIYSLNIEKEINFKVIEFNKVKDQNRNFLEILGMHSLEQNDLYELMSISNKAYQNIEYSIGELKKSEFLISNLRDEIQNFLWNPILENAQNISEDDFPEFFLPDAFAFQEAFSAKIEDNYETIKTKKVHFDANTPEILAVQLDGDVVLEKSYCADRGIPIESVKVKASFFNQTYLETLFYRCEAGRELTLSSHFQKFLGFDDLTDSQTHFYFFEFLETIPLEQLVFERKIDCSENTVAFQFVASALLEALTDLVYQSTHSFELPLSLENVFFDLKNLRLILKDIRFGAPRRKITESHCIVEAKVLFNFAVILLELVTLSKPQLRDLNLAKTEFEGQDEYMQRIFNNIKAIESRLNQEIDNDLIIAVLIECMVTPYKANLVLSSVYEKKNFLSEIFEADKKVNLKRKQTPKPSKMRSEKEETELPDEIVTKEKYYENGLEEENQTTVNRPLTLRLLQIYPYFKDCQMSNERLSYLFKCNEA